MHDSSDYHLGMMSYTNVHVHAQHKKRNIYGKCPYTCIHLQSHAGVLVWNRSIYNVHGAVHWMQLLEAMYTHVLYNTYIVCADIEIESVAHCVVQVLS